MGFAQIRGKLTSRIGRLVRFGPPGDVLQQGGAAGTGSVVDEVWADPSVNDSPPRSPKGTDDWGDYSFCAQLIRWDHGEHSIRLAYYRRRAGENHWEYASQMTVNADCRTVKILLERTLSRTHWFADSPQTPHTEP